MITHRNSRHVRRRLAACRNLLPVSWTLPKTVALRPFGNWLGKMCGLKSPPKSGLILTELAGRPHRQPPLLSPASNYLPGGMQRIQRRGRLHFSRSAQPSPAQPSQLCSRCFPCITFPGLAGFTWILLPPLLCLLSEVFSLRLFFPATVTDSDFGHRCIWTHNKDGLTSCLSWFRCTRVCSGFQPTDCGYSRLITLTSHAAVLFLLGGHNHFKLL